MQRDSKVILAVAGVVTNRSPVLAAKVEKNE